MNTIIEKIRAEVERLKKEHKVPTFPGDEYEEGGINGYHIALDKVLAKLDTLQEQPVCDGLEEEIKTRWGILNRSGNDIPFDTFNGIASQFAKWGAEHAKECEECPSRGNTHSYLKGLEDGKKEMKEQMMKEAVEGEVFNAHLHNEGDVFVQSDYLSKEQFKPGERVRMIIVKGD